MTIMESEIFSQPEAVKNCREYNLVRVKELAAEVNSRRINHIMLAARGSSDNACSYFKYLCEIYFGVPVSLAAPSVFTIYEGKLNLYGTLVIGVSQSGRGEDIKAVLDRARSQGGLTCAITNDLSSPVAKAAEYSLFLNVGEEKSVAATKTYTAQMYLLALLAAELSGDVNLGKAVEGVPELITETLKHKGEAETAAARYKDADDCYVLARGIAYAAAQETALKIKETTYVKAHAYAISDFHHGPFAVVDENSRIILLGGGGKTGKDTLEMADKIKATGADLTAITSDKALAEKCNYAITLPAYEECVGPFALVACAQTFACALSQLRGLNPDSPRGLKKVTITK